MVTEAHHGTLLFDDRSGAWTRAKVDLGAVSALQVDTDGVFLGYSLRAGDDADHAETLVAGRLR